MQIAFFCCTVCVNNFFLYFIPCFTKIQIYVNGGKLKRREENIFRVKELRVLNKLLSNYLNGTGSHNNKL
jgi:hypothetical protein